MKRSKKIFLAMVSCLAFLAMRPETARACAACYGETDNPMSKGLTWAITALVAVVGVVLGGVVVFFVHAVRNAPPVRGEEPPMKQD